MKENKGIGQELKDKITTATKSFLSALVPHLEIDHPTDLVVLKNTRVDENGREVHDVNVIKINTPDEQ